MRRPEHSSFELGEFVPKGPARLFLLLRYAMNKTQQTSQLLYE